MADEYYVTSPVVQTFMADVLQVVTVESSPPRCIERIRPQFEALLATPGWLPEEFACASPTSKMGGSIAFYLLYRRGDRSLTLHALVIPPASITPVHDHLAWGLVGVYRGEQEEEIFRHVGPPPPSSCRTPRASRAAPPQARRFLCAAAPGRGHPPGTHNIIGHVDFHSSVRKRFRVHLASLV